MASGVGGSGRGTGWGAAWLSVPTHHEKTRKAAIIHGKSQNRAKSSLVKASLSSQLSH